MARTDKIGAHATTIERDADGILRVRYHATDVVTVYPNGRIVLNHGGWTTPTTKLRMNQASNQLGLGFRVYQLDFAWFVNVDGRTLEFYDHQLTIRNGV